MAQAKDETRPEEQVEEMKELRDQAREKLKASRRDQPKELKTDEEGIKFLVPQPLSPPPLCGVDRTIMKYPLWANGVVRDGDGTVRPKIVMVPVSEQHSGGQLVEIYKRKKGFREVSEIPDRYAKFRDPYLKAIAEWRERVRKRAELQKQLEEAGFIKPRRGVTGVGSMAGLASVR